MGRTPIRAKLVLDAEARSKLEIIAKSRTEGHPCLPAHPKKVSTGMKGINGDEKMDKS
jgi:hypothetical protein